MPPLHVLSLCHFFQKEVCILLYYVFQNVDCSTCGTRIDYE